MLLELPQSWLIHKYPSGDTSLRLIFFTAERGLLNCFYKGGRTPKKQGLLQLFSPLWLALDVRGSSYFVRKIEMQVTPYVLQSQSLFAALYMNELLQLALRQDESHRSLFDTYANAVTALQGTIHKPNIEMILRRFEWAVLVASGYAFSMREEAQSGAPIVANQQYDFIPGTGFIVAKQGFLGRYILALADDELIDDTILAVAKQIMRRAIYHAIDGQEIKSRTLYTQTLS